MLNRIVEARKRNGFSQKELAQKLGISASTLNGYEKGNHDPKSPGLIAIANACNVTVDFLLGLSDNPEHTFSNNAPPSNAFIPQADSDLSTAYHTALGRRIQQRRKELNLSQDSLARLCGYTAPSSRSTIQKIEKGTTDPSVSTVKKLAAALQCSINYLLGLDEPEKNDMLSEREKDLLTAYHAAPQSTKDIVDVALRPYMPVQVKDEAM